MSVYFISGLSQQAKIALKFIKPTNFKSYATVALIEVYRERVVFTATCGHILYTSEVRQNNENIAVSGCVRVVVDIPTLKYLAKKGSSLRYCDGELDGTNFISKPSSVEFPKYEPVLKQFIDSPIAVEPTLFSTESLDALTLMGNADIVVNVEGIHAKSALGDLVVVAMRKDK